jgi:hypothetical protein
MPPSLPSPYADEGTVAHLVGEWCLRTGRDAAELAGLNAVEILKGQERRFELESDAKTMKGWIITKNIIEVTDEMAEAVQIYLDAIRFDMDTFGLTINDIKIEHKFHLTSVHPDAFGTNDCNLPIPFDRVIVYDYKHGKGVTVDVEENKQLMYYALGACQEGDFDQVEIVIIQPRAGGDPIRRWTLSVKELEKFAVELKGRIESTRDPKAPLNCGPWCKKTFCPAMAICPAVRGQVESDAKVAFADSKPIAFPKPEDMSPELLRRILDGMDLMDQWLKSVFSYAETVANGGQEIPGYKLVRGRQGNRKWADEKEAEKALLKFIEDNAGIEDVIYAPREILSPAKMEKMKELKSIVEPLTIRTEGKIILVPENDPREAVSPSAIDVFKQQDSIESLL